MTVPQQAFLRDAMRRLNMTREAFASRIGVSRRALDTWLLPDDSQESRGMPRSSNASCRKSSSARYRKAEDIRKA